MLDEEFIVFWRSLNEHQVKYIIYERSDGCIFSWMRSGYRRC